MIDPELSEDDAKMAGQLTLEVLKSGPLVMRWVHNLMRQYDEKVEEVKKLKSIIKQLKKGE